jgi:hypothetical protein
MNNPDIPEVVDERRLEGGFDFKSVLLYHLNRTLECLSRSREDYGVSFLNSVDALESIMLPYQDDKFESDMKEIEKDVDSTKKLSRMGKRILMGKMKLGALTYLMYRRHLLMGDVESATA